MRALLATAASLVVLAVLPAGAAAQETYEVGALPNPWAWTDEDLEIAPGDTVRWCFDEAAGTTPPCQEIDAAHNVQIKQGATEVALSGLFTISQGAEAAFEYTFNDEGSFTYVCQLHPVTMVGNLEVTEPTGEDTTAPVTTMSMDPEDPGLGGIYDGPVEITLDASDEAGGSGLDATFYSVDGGPYEEYTAPFTISDEGEHTVGYYSTDLAANEETHHEADFTINLGGPAALKAKVQPKKKSAKVGRNVAFKVNLRNTGGQAADEIKVCAKVKKKKVSVTGGKCWTLMSLDGGESKTTKFTFKAKRSARGDKVPIKFVTTADGLQSQTDKATLKVKR